MSFIQINESSFNYLPFQFKDTSKYFNAWKKLIKSSEFTLGPYVKKFRKITFKICKSEILYFNK